MNKSTFKAIALSFALVLQALPMVAQNQVRLTFNRVGGTAASNVTVNVADENNQAIKGVTASLVSVKEGTNGTDATAPSTNVALLATNALANHPEIICAKYKNEHEVHCFAEFTFKISGLSSFAFNHMDMQLAAMNKDGDFQYNILSRNCDVRVWNDEGKTQAAIVSKDGIETDKNTALIPGSNPKTGIDNTTDWEIKSSASTTTKDQYFVVRLIKSNGNKGCYFGLKQITLYNGYRIATTATSNIDRVATFSASNNVVFGSDVKAYIASTVNATSNEVTLLPLNGALKAKDGAIVSTTSTADVYAYVSSAAVDSRENILVGGGDEALSLTANNYYIFNKSGEEAVFSPLAADGNLAANKAALKSVTAGAQPLNLSFGDVTGIHTLPALQLNKSANTVYDLSGRKVSGSLPKGIYISNGKKFMVK